MATREKRDEKIRARDEALGAATEQETANRRFLERVELLPGVLRVEQHQDRISGEYSFRIYVPLGNRSTQYAIYQLEAEVYQLHPGTYLDVHVTAVDDVTTPAAGPPIPAP